MSSRARRSKRRTTGTTASRRRGTIPASRRARVAGWLWCRRSPHRHR